MNKSRLKSIVNAILIFILFFYSWLFQTLPVLVFNLDVKKITSTQIVWLRAFSSMMLTIVLFFIYRKEIIIEWKKFKDNFGKNVDIGLSYWLKGLVLMVVFNTILNVLFHTGVANNEKAVQDMITTMPWLMLIMSGVFAPWSEELVFRKSIRKIFKSRWFYIIFSGFLFGLAHVFSTANTFTDWLFILPYGSLGVAFAASYYDSDTIFTPIMFHMLHNIFLVLVAIFL